MPAKKTTAKKSTAKKTATKRKASPAKKAASPKARTASTKPKAKSTAGDKEVTLDRRTKANRRDEVSEQPAVQQPVLERREKVQRRRQIDPTTCERDYSIDEVAFMNAMDDYKRKSGRMFPTCSEVLEVIRDLGYVQLTPAEMATVRPEPVATPELADETPADFEEAELEAAEMAF